ncbi:MAG TPA: ferritin [Acidimicrobiia bacterium]|jgi:ferritin|nr:ferritin [Acidimicrobiia bacterium]
MALPAKLAEAFNSQITLEFAAAYQYLATAAWLESESFPGMAQWMQMQSEEEWTHGMRFYQFVLDRDASVKLGAIPAPHDVFDSPYAAFESALVSEQQVTASINDLYALATEMHDYASLPLLDWFVNEQVEEEAAVTQIIDDLERAGADGHTLLMLDRELGARPPVEA